MKKDTMIGLVAGGIIGATVSAYAFTNMSPREQKKMLKRGRKIITTAAYLLGGMRLM